MQIPPNPDLKVIPLLKDVSQRAMRSAGREARWFSLPAGQPLFLAGELAESIFFVVSEHWAPLGPVTNS